MHFCTSFFILKVGTDDVCCFQNRAPFTFYGIIGQLRLMFGFFGGWVVSCLPFLGLVSLVEDILQELLKEECMGAF